MDERTHPQQHVRRPVATPLVPPTFARVTSRPKASTAFVLVTLATDALGTGLVSPIVPGLVRHLGHLPPQAAAPWVGALIAAYAAMQFALAPLLGELSDRFGRRPVILISVAGLGFDNLLLAVAPNLWWLFLGRLVAGASAANVSTSTAYLSHIADTQDRARLFGLVGAAFGAGFVVGPAVGGILGAYGLRLPFIAAACLSLINALFGIFVLPESLPRERRRPIQWANANPIRLITIVWRERTLGRLAIAWSCSWIGLGAVQSSLVLFTGHRFGWGSQLNGLVLAGVGLSQALVEGVLVRPTVGWLGERRAAITGYVLGAAGYAVLSVAFAGWTMMPAVMLMAFGGLATPSVRAMVSGRRDAEHQGEVQGLLSAVEGLTAIFAPLLTAGLFYAATSHGFPGAPFAVAALSGVVACVLLRGL